MAAVFLVTTCTDSYALELGILIALGFSCLRRLPLQAPKGMFAIFRQSRDNVGLMPQAQDRHLPFACHFIAAEPSRAA